MKVKTAYVFISWALLLVSFNLFAENISLDLKIYPQPTWIKYQSPNLSKKAPEDQIKNGTYYLLYDRQIKITDKNERQTYIHFSEQVVNQNGLQNVSNISINYDPAYETVQWHHVSILRAGEIINKQTDAKVSILHREKELEDSVYNGRLTENVILSDVRVGDIVDYSYSVVGANPIYAGHFADMEYAEWAVAVGDLHVLVDWGKGKELHYKSFNTNQELSVSKQQGHALYEFTQSDIKARTMNTQTPPWYDPYAHFYFSDLNGWKDVVDWATPLYQAATKSSPDIKKVAETIKLQGGSESHQAALALHYVQDNIRYLGVEMGKNSHQPSLATDTLTRRYGDCKDKTVLLVTLLKELGIESSPVLVNTDLRKGIVELLPSINAFDHVLVYLRLNGKNYWIDPTREYQKGDLEIIFQANYGYGLVISSDTPDLVKMESHPNSSEKIVENVDVSGTLDDSAQYTISTAYTGYEAEVQRSNFLGSNIKEKSDQYLNYYKKFYEGIRVADKVDYQDNSLTGVFSVNEKYTIDKIWNDDKKPKYSATFYGSGITSAFPKPDEIARNSPFYVPYKEVKEVIHIKLDGFDWNIKNEHVQEKNAYFEYNSLITHDKENAILTLEFFYRTLTDTVPADEINTYLDLREKVVNQTEYTISETIGGVKEKSNAALWWLLAVFVYLAIVVYVIIDWFRDKTRFHHLTESKFYPVSLVKFILLSLATLGAYQIYWFYKNWSYVRRADNIPLSPFWRSIFTIFWVYPFYIRLIMSEESKNVSWLPASRAVAAAFALTFFLFLVFTNLEAYSFLFIILAILLLVPLAWQVLKIPQTDDAAVINNSRWKIRHSLLMLICAPWVACMLGMQLGVVHGSRIVEGGRLFAHDIRYMQRNKILPVGEKIIYFYSSAFFDIHDSGSGFTTKTVFAYWHDDDHQLIVKKVAFNHVKNIQLNEGGTEGQSMSVQDDKGDEFIVYLSSEKDKNKAFVREITKSWQQEKNSDNNLKDNNVVKNSSIKNK